MLSTHDRDRDRDRSVSVNTNEGHESSAAARETPCKRETKTETETAPTAATAMSYAVLAAYVGLWVWLLRQPLVWVALAVLTAWAVGDKAPFRGGRRSQWFRSLALWRWMARLFPVTIIRECELPASSPTDPPYVFGYSPHGFMSFGANLAFATEACGFARLFPGMHLRYLSIYSNLRVPLFHDFVLALGGCSVSRRSISHILQHGGAGRACMLVVGGIAEAKLAQPGTADLVLRRRRGFVRIAIQHGASLVPVFGFGENDIYDPVPPDSASWTHSLLRLVMRTTGFRYPLFSGRSLFSAAGGGLIPHFRPVTIVVGKPIPTTLAEDPADDVVDHVHQLYIAELQRIYDKYKDIYAPHRIRDMHIVS